MIIKKRPPPTNKVRVVTHSGHVTEYDGLIELNGRLYPLGRDTALSRLFFRVRGVDGTQLFFIDPMAYFKKRMEPPPGADADEEEIDAWNKHRSEFNARHAAFYDTRTQIQRDPEKYLKDNTTSGSLLAFPLE